MNISIPKELFAKNYLENLSENSADKYQTASPFSHIAFDNFLPADILEKVLSEFPDVNDSQWQQYKSETENGKLASSKYEMIPPYTRYVLDQLNTPPFLQFLENLTGIKHLIPDPYYTGGGMHQTKRGGWLGVHVDFNKYDQLKVYRRINVLIYLNKDWKPEYGGDLELWDDKMEKIEEKIAPIFNRCAIFTTSENSHHGHPDPITCPEGETRKSLAWYYYTVENGENLSSKAHTTLFKARPNKDKNYKTMQIKSIIRSFIPPIVITLTKKILGR
jgi:Rps23 Pro-64 3,4-dihydroxylase Tpa1-like proline 4-hydroxylase